MEFILLFCILPFISIGLLFLKDTNTRRKRILNSLIILNVVVYSLPMVSAFFSTPKGESMFNENTGGGAVLWFYMLLLPLCGFVLFVLLVLKLVFAFTSKSKTLES